MGKVGGGLGRVSFSFSIYTGGRRLAGRVLIPDLFLGEGRLDKARAKYEMDRALCQLSLVFSPVGSLVEM
jgi:hypothetical protein